MKSRKYQYKGALATVLEIAADTGINRGTLYKRLQAAGNVMSEEILIPPDGPGPHAKLRSEDGTLLTEIAKTKNLLLSTVNSRYDLGYRSDRMLGARVNKGGLKK